MTTMNEMLKEHVSLDIECIDRLYLNGYIPQMQTGGQLVNFLRQRGNAIPSPAILGALTTGYKVAVERYAELGGIPLIHFEHGQRKDEIVATYRESFAKAEGVVVIGIAQEKATGFKAKKRNQGQMVGFDYSRQSVYVNQYYFYVQDRDFGPAFIKVCTYAPYGVKVCINGHEWAKCQLRQEGIGFEALDNGFLSCTDPQRLQALCDELGPTQIGAFFEKWQRQLPWFLTAADRAAGIDYRLSVWQAEFSRTHVFRDATQGRQWFEAVIRENLDVGRPDRIQLIFDRKVTKATPGRFQTKVVQEGVSPSLHAYYKQTHLKQYFKEQRALRTETTINNPKDFGVNKDISNLPFLQQLGRQINQRLLDAQQLSFDCILSAQSLQRIVLPSISHDGQHAPALRLGEPRVMALLNALSSFQHIPDGLTNQSLRTLVIDLLALDPAHYTSAQMSYDLRRLRLKGIIWRIPDSYRYQLTTYGRKVALLLSKLDSRLFRPLFAALDALPSSLSPLAQLLHQIDAFLDSAISNANLATVAT